MKRQFSPFLRSALFAATVFGLGTAAQAGTYSWNTTTGNWDSSSANWTGAGSTWVDGNDAVFNNTATASTITLIGTINATSLLIGNNGNNANYSITGGTLNNSGTLIVQGSGGNSGSYTANPTTTINSSVAVAGSTLIGRANLAISGGNYTTNRFTANPTSADWANITISGGTVTATNGIDGTHGTTGSNGSTATFALNLNGGTLYTPSIRVADREAGTNNNAWLTFNGTTVKPTADTTSFITLYGGNQNSYISNGGAIIDTYDDVAATARNITIGVNLRNTTGQTGTLTKNGAGTLTLSGANTYTGTTTINGGTLALQNTYGSSGFSMASGTMLDLNVAGTDRNCATTTFSGTGTLLKTGSNMVVWGAGAATFNLGSGALIDVQGGTFTGGSNANEVWTSNLSDLNVASGATFNTVEANVRVNKITGTGTIKTGYSGAGYANFTIGVDNGSSTFGGSVQNSTSNGNLVKTGSGTIILSGNNSHGGATTISGGSLEFSGTNTIGAVTANGGGVSFTGGTTTISGNLSQTMDGGNAITIINSTVTMNQLYSGANDLGSIGMAFTIGAGADVTATGGTFSRTWRGSGGMFLNGGTLRTSYLAANSASSGLNDRGYIHFNGTRIVATANQSNFIQLAGGANYGNENFAKLNATTTFDAAGSNIGIGVELRGTGGLTKDGVGTLTLSGANTYTGGTTVNTGVLELSGSNSGTGRIRGPLTVNAEAEVRLTNDDGTGFGYNDARISSLSINGGAVSSAGTLHIWNLAGGVNLTGGSLSSNDGVSSATAPQLEWGNTTLTSNASADTATVAGRIHIRRDAAPMLRVNVADGSAATDLLISAALTESGSGCGLVKSGAGTLKLGGAVNLTGFLTVNAGTLDLSTATLGESARINVVSGAQFIPPTSGLPATAALYVNGQKLSPGTWGAPGSVAAGLAQFESPVISGSTVITVPDTGISNRERWKSLKYGIFSHYTRWATGTGDVNEAADAFNAQQYADDLEQAGVQYVVWTAWHGSTFPMFPSQTMVKYGWPNRFSTRDTVNDMIDAVKAKGIRVYLYTHPYQPITSPNSRHNDFINELYAELIARYGSRIDGLWIDENQINGDQDSLVDYKRLMTTIKEGNPELVTMQNGGQMYTVDMGGPEIVGNWNFGWSESMYNLVNPGSGPGMDDMLRTTVLEASANFEGGGMHWSIDGVANGGLVETTRALALGRYLAPIRSSVCETTPSASFPPPYKDGRTVSYSTVDWVATTSMDETKEFIHVLKAPSGNTLTLPGTADGKVFSSATLIASLQPGGGTQQYLGLPMAMLQTPRGILLTLPSGVSWSSLDTVIQLDVVSKGGSGMVNDTSTSITYSGSSWYYQNHRGTGEFNDDIHSTTANGDSFTFTFSGTDVEYIASRSANRGPVDIYIDEVFQATVDLSSGTPTGSRQSVFKKSGLARGTHTLRCVKMGGSYMDSDAFRVSELVNDGDADLAAGFPSTYNLGARSAAYTGRWQPGSGAVAWITPGTGIHAGAEPLTGSLPTSGDSFEFSFYGTAASVTVGSQHAWGYFYFMVDGVFQTNVQVSTSSGLQTFSTGTLPLGNHTIKGIVWRATGDPFQPGVNGFTVTRPDLWNYQTGRGYGEIGDDVHYTDVNPGAFSYAFTGSGVDVITTRDSDARMAWFGVSGMGRSVGARRNNYSPVRQTGTSVFSMPNLTPGAHSVSVQHGANTSGLNFSFARLAIDALRVYKGESLSAAPLYWGATGNGGSGTWDIGGTANWFDGGQATAWQDFGGNDYSAVFTGTTGTVNLASNINANRLTFKTAGYTLQGNSLTLNGSAPTLTTDANATIASALGGSSGLTKAGSGTLSVTGPNTYTGATTIAAGTLALNGSYATSGFAIATGAVLDFNAATALNLLAVTISGTGTLRKTGSNQLLWGSSAAVFALGSDSLIDVQTGTFVGGSNANENWTNNLADLNVAAGTIFKGVEANVRVDVLTGTGVIRSGYSGAGYSAFTFGVDNGTGTFNGSLTNDSAPGNFIKTGTGTQTLAGSNTYTGTTTINDGKLIITGSLNNTLSVTIATGATLEISGSLAVTGSIVNNGTLILTGAPQMSALGTITNNGTIINLVPGFALPPNLVNNGSIQSGPGVSVDYTTWASNAGLAGGPDSDDDGDGLNNRSEYAFALNPKSGSSANPITIPLKPADGTFTYTRRDPALGTNLAYSVWTSPDLASWTQDASASQTVTSTQGDVQSVRVTISPSRLSSSKLFVQVRATIP